MAIGTFNKQPRKKKYYRVSTGGFCDIDKKERLTLVFFIREIQSSGFYPLQRLNSNKTNLKNETAESLSVKQTSMLSQGTRRSDLLMAERLFC